ncbi:MAG: PA2169 family four-helix-bundle protein [Flavobacterium sp.]
MKKDEAINLLNELIIICNDRIHIYTIAESETDAFDLKALFFHFTASSKLCKEELVKEVKALGGTVARGTSTSGVFFRVWGHVKKTLLTMDRRIILISCEFGECLVLNTYSKVLDNKASFLNKKQLSMLYSQKSVLQKDQKYLTSFSEVFLQMEFPN